MSFPLAREARTCADLSAAKRVRASRKVLCFLLPRLSNRAPGAGGGTTKLESTDESKICRFSIMKTLSIPLELFKRLGKSLPLLLKAVLLVGVKIFPGLLNLSWRLGDCV